MLLVTGLDRSVSPATQEPYPAPVIDPQKKARDADRDAAIEVVEAAYADGQISRPDYDLRVDRLLRATTVGELQMLIQDLRLPEGEHVTEAVEVVTALDEESPSASRPGPNLSAAKIVLVSAAAVLALGLVVPLVLVSRVDSTGHVASGSAEVGSTVDLTSGKGFTRLVREVEAKTGSSTVFNAVIYPSYAVVEVPEDAKSQRSFGWYYNGEWDEWTGTGTAEEERFELDQINGRTLAALVKEARGLVDKPTTSYVIVNALGRDQGVCMSVYAGNDHAETAYLDARCDGTVVRTYVS